MNTQAGRRAPWWATWAALAGTLSVSAAASAEPALSGSQKATAPAAAEPESLERAAALFHEAEARYGVGDLAGARALMLSSYQLSGRPELLFNLGDLERELGHCPEALRDYTEYLSRVKDGTHRDQAEHHRAELEAQCPERAAVPATVMPVALAPVAPAPAAVSAPAAPAPPPAPPPDPYWTPLRIVGWSSLGASAIAGTVATYFAVSAANDESSLDHRIQGAQASNGSVGFSAEDKALESEGERSANLARGFAAGAVGLAVVGVSLLLVPTSRAKGSTNGVAVSVGVSGPTAVYRGSF